MNTVSGVKTQSNWLGNVKLSAFQIRQIIEIKRPLISDVKMNKAKCKQTSDHKIQGDNKKLQSGAPPLKMGDKNKNKRLRSELSPEQTGTGKKATKDVGKMEECDLSGKSV